MKVGIMASLPTPESTASFWHSEPSEFLLGHRTTPELPNHADVVIVGSGITGASAARFLAEDSRAGNLSVVMLDAREACWGATGRNGGHCQPLLFSSTPDIAAFELRNYNTVKDYIKKHDISCEWRDLTGCRTFWTKQLAEAAAREVQELKHADPELGKEVTVISKDEELRKHMVSGASVATLTAKAASLWPYKLVAFTLEELIRSGDLNLQTKTPVTKIERQKNDSDIRSNIGWSLHTPRGIIEARHVILATNAYTSHLLPEFGDLIVPERGIMTALLPPTGSIPLNNSYGFVGAMGGNPQHDDYLIQRPLHNVPNPGGHLMFGGGRVAGVLEAIGETDDSIIDEGSAAYLRQMLLTLMTLGGMAEDLKELKATHQWSGIWGTSKDHHPWVGAVPDRSGVWLAGGYTGKYTTYLDT